MEFQFNSFVPQQQSRLDKRAHQIAQMEEDYAIAKGVYERTMSTRYRKLMYAIRAEIKPLARQQALDRKILDNLYSLDYIMKNGSVEVTVV